MPGFFDGLSLSSPETPSKVLPLPSHNNDRSIHLIPQCIVWIHGTSAKSICFLPAREQLISLRDEFRKLPFRISKTIVEAAAPVHVQLAEEVPGLQAVQTAQAAQAKLQTAQTAHLHVEALRPDEARRELAHAGGRLLRAAFAHATSAGLMRRSAYKFS